MTRNNSVTKHLLEGKEHHTEITWLKQETKDLKGYSRINSVQ